MLLTDEQLAAIEAFHTGESIRIVALAGTGKTTVLREMARQTKRRGTYLAFNTEIAATSREDFPGNVECRTIHAAALGRLPAELRQKAGRGADFNWQHLHDYLQERHDLRGDLSMAVAYAVACTLDAFTRCVDRDLTQDHVVVADAGNRGHFDPDTVLGLARATWRSMANVDGALPLTHDAYLKLAFLLGVRFEGDFVLVDETQDLNELTLALIEASKCQIVWVGDPNQQLYEFRGADKAMDRVRYSSAHSLTQGFRCGSAIADTASKLLSALGGEVLRPQSTTSSEIARRHQAIRLVRSNVTLFRKIVELAARHRRVHVLGGTQQLHGLVDDIERLKSGQPVFGGIFSGYGSWREVQDCFYERPRHRLKPFIDLADQLGVRRLRAGLNKLPKSANDADVVLGTIHAAKGCEWPAVSVYHDFFGLEPLIGRFKAIPEEQFRLLYVAVTRARSTLFLESATRKRFGLLN